MIKLKTPLLSWTNIKINSNFKELRLKTLSEYNSPLGMEYTILFQVEKENTIVPINLAFESGRKLLSLMQNDLFPNPHIYDTIRRLTACVGAKPIAILIAMYLGKVYYTFIQLEHRGRTYEVGTNLPDAILLAVSCKIPILIEEKLSKIMGIKLDSENNTTSSSFDYFKDISLH